MSNDEWLADKPSNTETNDSQDKNWERDTINKLVFSALNEQRRTRRWSIFFKSLMFAYLFVLLIMFYIGGKGVDSGIKSGDHTALIDIQGVISEGSPASADNIVTGLRNAFENKHTAGVILRSNSPGGSPVQSGYIYDEIVRLREKYPDIPIYTVITDICASGCYYIAAATEQIYADKASLVGSIGVLMNSFGFVGTMDKLGVERRLYTAGEHKGFLDPFSPEKSGDVEHIKTILENTHQQFINAVKEGRGERLQVDNKLFSGFIWNGEQSIQKGLVDFLGGSSHVAREVVGAENIVDFTPRPHYFERFVERFSSGVTSELLNRFSQGELQY
ncbi:MAG: S49 family peptidase [Gammaproteobacteria bacterium]|nr:S49 family peptidase [Gammaproteobacteria bacterium]